MAHNDQQFERLKQKYQPALQLMQKLQVQLQGLGMEGSKLLIRGVAPSSDVKNKIWDQIKLIDAGYSDLTCDLTISQTQATMTAGSGSGAWTDAISDIFIRHAGMSGGTAPASADPHADYRAIAEAAPPQAMAAALATAFRSDQTPSFPEMVSSLFRQSSPDQKAGLLSQLMGAVSPAVLASVPELKELAGSSRGPGVTPLQASQISAEQVQRAAADAQRENPSIIDQVSGFYARHPDVVKALGGAAISIAIQSMARRK